MSGRLDAAMGEKVRDRLADLCELMERRRSTRAFLPKPVPSEDIEKVIALAANAPSGGNMQPWCVDVLGGEARQRLLDEVRRQTGERGKGTNDDYIYYPGQRLEPYSSRIVQAGADLYEALGLGVRDVVGKRRQKQKNYDFYGAPVGLIVSLDRRLEAGSWIDIGIFIAHVVLACEALDLQSCVQASFCSYGDAVRSVLGLPDEQVVICGVAIGHGDPEAPENRLPRRRAEIRQFATFHP